jgi:hypothetical protein
VLKTRTVFAALLAFWLIIGPAASTLGANAAKSCENMTAADGCCESSMDRAACVEACIAATAVLAVPATLTASVDAAQSRITSLSFRYATVLAPPDIAPPKSFVS